MIESLESRIAPAAIVTFTETDGDKVTVKTSKGTKAELEHALGFASSATNINGMTLNFLIDPATAQAFAGTNITITAKGGTGDTAKLANFVKINAFDGAGMPNIDLGVVNIKGNLVFCDAGDENLSTLAIKKLNVTNWLADNGKTAANTSQIRGNIGAISVANVFDGYIFSSGQNGTSNFKDINGTVIQSFTAKNIAEDDGVNSGHIQVQSIAKLTVKGTFFGSTNGSAGNGLIEAHSLKTINMHAMGFNAQIVLS